MPARAEVALPPPQTVEDFTPSWNGGAPQQLCPDRLALRRAGLSGVVLQVL